MIIKKTLTFIDNFCKKSLFFLKNLDQKFAYKEPIAVFLLIVLIWSTYGKNPNDELLKSIKNSFHLTIICSFMWYLFIKFIVNLSNFAESRRSFSIFIRFSISSLILSTTPIIVFYNFDSSILYSNSSGKEQNIVTLIYILGPVLGNLIIYLSHRFLYRNYTYIYILLASTAWLILMLPSCLFIGLIALNTYI